MKARIKKAPRLETFLELNKKFGYGYQARMIMDGVFESVIDTEPFSLDEAYSGAVFAIEEINKETGYGYDPYNVIAVTGEALEANKSRDFISARVARDVDRGRGELAYPVAVDYTTKEIDGDAELCFTGRGVVLIAFFAWKDDKVLKSREVLRRYCQYLALQGYGGGANEIWQELENMDTERGSNWIRATYEKYVKDDAAAINYILSEA